MATVMKTIKNIEDGYLELMARVEKPVVRLTGEAAERVAEYVPERPDWAFLDELPTVTELVNNQLRFRRRVVDQQAAFVRRMVKAMHPALVRLEPEKPARKAPAARRTAARRPAPVRRIRPKAA
jgi:hypothetical protein